MQSAAIVCGETRHSPSLYSFAAGLGALNACAKSIVILLADRLTDRQKCRVDFEVGGNDVFES